MNSCPDGKKLTACLKTYIFKKKIGKNLRNAKNNKQCKA